MFLTGAIQKNITKVRQRKKGPPKGNKYLWTVTVTINTPQKNFKSAPLSFSKAGSFQLINAIQNFNVFLNPCHWKSW